MSSNKIYFRGFCSLGQPVTRDWTYYDVELIKRDLLFAFNTRVGERVMRPNWGCKIWDYMMEPLTSGMQDLIVNEALRICGLDSRLVVNSCNAYTLGAGIRVELSLIYRPFGLVDSFFVDFDARQTATFGY